MRRAPALAAVFAVVAITLVVAIAGCGARGAVAAVDAAATDGGAADAATAPGDGSMPASDGAAAAADGGATVACQWSGAPGSCMTTAACAALADHTSEPGSCAGPATIQCCIDTPNVADNPPVPTGYVPMMQSQVTPAMTNWAVMILHDPVTYPMYATTTQTFGALTVLARVEWHPPDFQNGVVHRGVTLYVPR